MKWPGIIIVLYAAAFEIDKMLALPLVNSAGVFFLSPKYILQHRTAIFGLVGSHTLQYILLFDEPTDMKGMPLMEESSIGYRSLSLGAFLCLLILTATLGNLLVCIAVVTEKSLRKLSNLFFVSLAVSDLLVGAMVMPFALVNDLSSWRFGQDFCKLWIASDVMCSTASILNLMAISFDRLGAVVAFTHFCFTRN